jgi:hypothetical protein
MVCFSSLSFIQFCMIIYVTSFQLYFVTHECSNIDFKSPHGFVNNQLTTPYHSSFLQVDVAKTIDCWLTMLFGLYTSNMNLVFASTCSNMSIVKYVRSIMTYWFMVAIF